MKSQRYQVLPRLRLYSSGLYVCVWKDPDSLIQRKGEPLRYVYSYTGCGDTPAEAIRNCQKQVLLKQESVDRLQKDIDRLIQEVESPSTPPYFEIKAPDHCLATSNHPWWKRLLRI